MNNKLTVAIALVTGLLGGILTRYAAPPTAFAQATAPAPKEVRAQSFTLVDSANRTVGTFTTEVVRRLRLRLNAHPTADLRLFPPTN